MKLKTVAGFLWTLMFVSAVTIPTQAQVTVDDRAQAKCSAILNSSAADKEQLEACEQALKNRFPRPTARTASSTEKETDEQRRARIRGLVDAHKAYKKLKARMKGADLSDIREGIHSELRAAGLYEPIAAVYDTGIVVTDTGVSSGFPVSSAGNIKGDTANYVRFSSKHFRDEEWPADFSFGGRIGFGPTLAIVNCVPCTANALRQIHMQSFSWEMDGRTNIHVSNLGELSGFVRVGQNRLSDKETKVSDGATMQVAQLAANGISQTALFSEFGAEFRYDQKELDISHHDKSFLTPAFAARIGLRNDTRFRKSGDLAAFDSPEKRMVFGMSVSLPKLLGDPNAGNPEKALNFTFAVEHERGFGANPLPSGTRLYFMGKLNLATILGDKK